jgi:hypothetical protein
MMFFEANEIFNKSLILFIMCVIEKTWMTNLSSWTFMPMDYIKNQVANSIEVMRDVSYIFNS